MEQPRIASFIQSMKWLGQRDRPQRPTSLLEWLAGLLGIRPRSCRREIALRMAAKRGAKMGGRADTAAQLSGVIGSRRAHAAA
jgi:hypothetical protein